MSVDVAPGAPGRTPRACRSGHVCESEGVFLREVPRDHLFEQRVEGIDRDKQLAGRAACLQGHHERKARAALALECPAEHGLRARARIGDRRFGDLLGNLLDDVDARTVAQHAHLRAHVRIDERQSLDLSGAAHEGPQASLELFAFERADRGAGRDLLQGLDLADHLEADRLAREERV